MSVTNIIKESLHYPLIDIKKWMMVGVFFVVINLLNLIGLNYPTFNGVTGMVTFLLDIIVFGYGVSITTSIIKGSEGVPDFNLKNNLTDGIKLFVLYFVYSIIPFIISLVAAFASGLFTNLFNAYLAVSQSTGGNITSLTSFTGSIPSSVMSGLISGFIITLIVMIIVFISFMFFANIGVGRLAETGSLKEGLNIKFVIAKIGSIGWGKYLTWYVLLIIVSVIFSIFSLLLMLIPVIGFFLAGLIVSSFVLFFSFSAIGKIYVEE